MGFILDGLDTESYDRTYTDRELVARILGYFRPHAGKMALVALMLTLNSTASSGMPILIAETIDAFADESIKAAYLPDMAAGKTTHPGWAFVKGWKSSVSSA